MILLERYYTINQTQGVQYQRFSCVDNLVKTLTAKAKLND